jgi:citrate lyase subunit beta/citryl-CoA lyase
VRRSRRRRGSRNPARGSVLGTNDLAKETGANRARPRADDGWLSTCVLAARAYGILILDGSITTCRMRKGSCANASKAAISASTARR